jgi:hypothetical protein
MYVIRENTVDRIYDGEFQVGYWQPDGSFYVEEKFHWCLEMNDRQEKDDAKKSARKLCSRLNGGS